MSASRTLMLRPEVWMSLTDPSGKLHWITRGYGMVTAKHHSLIMRCCLQLPGRTCSELEMRYMMLEVLVLPIIMPISIQSLGIPVLM